MERLSPELVEPVVRQQTVWGTQNIREGMVPPALQGPIQIQVEVEDQVQELLQLEIMHLQARGVRPQRVEERAVLERPALLMVEMPLRQVVAAEVQKPLLPLNGTEVQVEQVK